MRRLTIIGVFAAAALLAAACGSSPPSSTSASGPGGTLTISNESGGLWTCGFSPYNPNVNFLSFGPVYEPLVFINTLQSAKATPWLASKWAWGSGNKVVTFTIRKGVTFTDGTALTAADVAFTFNLMKKFPALDLNAVWSVLSSVTQTGSYQVTMRFKNAAVPYFYYVADQVGIVPEHIWSKIPKPVNFNDPHPVGTGAYQVKACTGQNITYTANRHYWMPGKPKVATVLYPAFTSNDPANTYLATGRAQWGGQFIPNIKAFYTSKSPDYHYWNPPLTNVAMFINLKAPGPLGNVAVRRAMAYAINRTRVAAIGENGTEPPANQTGIVTPTFASWLNKPAAAAYGNYSYNPAKAEQILTAAGFRKGPDGIFASPSGQKLSFTVIDIGDYSDWVASVQVVQQELKAAGIQITAENLSSNAYNTRLFNGNFQLAYGGETGGPTPYYELRQMLYTANSAPIGQSAATNWERYSNPATDALINAYGATTDAARQHQIVNQLEQVMLSEVPIIPVTEGVDFYQYNTAAFSGWPTPANPYAQPPPWSTPDWGQVLLHLTPKR